MDPAARMGSVVDQASASIESPVLAPRVARICPFVMLTSFVTPSVPPTATTVLDGLIARAVNVPASNRASKNMSWILSGWDLLRIVSRVRHRFEVPN